MSEQIDSKDSEDQAQVWAAVRLRVGSALTPLSSGATFDGIWDVSVDMEGTRLLAFQYDFKDRVTVAVTSLFGFDETTRSGQYAVTADSRVFIADSTYHAAHTDDGQLVLFNDDLSLLMVATKRPKA